MRKMKIMKILTGLAMLALTASLLAGCGKEAVNVTMPQEVAGAQSTNDSSTPVDVYWDSTYSMAGYTTIAAGNAYRNLPDELGDLCSSIGETTFYRFGQDITPIAGRDYRAFSTPGSYTEVVTSVQNAVSSANPDHLSIIVTDLFESDSDWSGVTEQLKDKYFSKHLAVAIIGIKNPFQGDIFDVGLDAQKFTYDSGSDPARYRPFYLFIAGPQGQVENFLQRFKERHASGENETQYLLFSEKLTEEPQDFQNLKIADSKNLYDDNNLDISDKRIHELGVSSMGDETELLVPFSVKPAMGTMPIADKKLLSSYKVFTLEDDGSWNAYENSSNDMKVDLIPDGASQENYQLKLIFTPEKCLADGKVNLVQVSAAPDIQAYKLPDWCQQWNMTDADVSTGGFDGAKTMNILRIAESLKEAVLQAAHPSIVNLDFVIDAR